MSEKSKDIIFENRSLILYASLFSASVFFVMIAIFYFISNLSDYNEDTCIIKQKSYDTKYDCSTMINCNRLVDKNVCKTLIECSKLNTTDLCCENGDVTFKVCNSNAFDVGYYIHVMKGDYNVNKNMFCNNYVDNKCYEYYENYIKDKSDDQIKCWYNKNDKSDIQFNYKYKEPNMYLNAFYSILVGFVSSIFIFLFMIAVFGYMVSCCSPQSPTNSSDNENTRLIANP